MPPPPPETKPGAHPVGAWNGMSLVLRRPREETIIVTTAFYAYVYIIPRTPPPRQGASTRSKRLRLCACTYRLQGQLRTAGYIHSPTYVCNKQVRCVPKRYEGYREEKKNGGCQTLEFPKFPLALIETHRRRSTSAPVVHSERGGACRTDNRCTTAPTHRDT